MNRRDRKKQQKRNAHQETLRHEKHLRLTNPQTGRGAKPAPETVAQGIAATEPAPPVDEVHNVEQAHDRPAIDDFFRLHDGAAWLNDLLLADPGSNHLIQPLWNTEIPGHLMLNCKTAAKFWLRRKSLPRGSAGRHVIFPRNRRMADRGKCVIFARPRRPCRSQRSPRR